MRDIRTVAVTDAFYEDRMVFWQVFPLPQGFWGETWSAMLCMKGATY